MRKAGSCTGLATPVSADNRWRQFAGRPGRYLCVGLALAFAASGCARDAATAGAGASTSSEAVHDTELEAAFSRRFMAFYVEAADGDADGLSPTRFARGSGIDPANPPWTTPLPDHLQRGMELPTTDAALEAVQVQMRAASLDPDDLVDVATYHAALAWLIVQRRRLDPSRLAAIRMQVYPALLDRLDEEGTLDDAALQARADAMALEAARLGHVFTAMERQGDRVGLGVLAEALRQGYMEQAGIDLGL